MNDHVSNSQLIADYLLYFLIFLVVWEGGVMRIVFIFHNNIPLSQQG